jgi:hypothetical protein
MTMNSKIMQSARMGLFLLLAAIFLLPSAALACGYGNSGGADYYTPQRQNPYATSQPATAISADQAKDLVTRQITKLNPNLSVSKVNDAGSYYEVEIVNNKNEIVQVLGVDKTTALLSLLN